MTAVAILDFGNFKFLTFGAGKRVELHDRANFVQIGPTAAEIWRFLVFQDGGLVFLKFLIFNDRDGQGVRRASPFQIWSKWLNSGLEYMAIFRFFKWRPPPSWIFEISNF